MPNSRRQFLKSAGATLVVAGAMPRALDAAGFDPFEKSIRELQRAMAAGQITSEQLVQFYLDRIAAYDQTGPRVNAVLYINPKAAADARSLDDERKRGRPRGPLHGIPILLKDNFDTKDMPTTGGCLALSGISPERRCVSGEEAPRGRRGDPGQGQPARARAGINNGQLARRADARPVRPDARAGWKQRRFGGRGHRKLRRGDARHRHQRLHPHPQFAQQRRRPPAEAWGSRAARASSRSAIRRTRADRLRGPWKTSQLSSTRRSASTRRIR